MEEKELVIRRSFRDDSPRKLIFNENFIKFENKDLANDLYTLFEKENITAYRFGIRWISFRLTYGREYQIFVRNNENNVIKISFKSYFGRKTTEHHQLYLEILDDLWTYFFSAKVDEYLKMFENNEEFSIGDVLFTKDNIVLNITGIVSLKRTTIPWKNIRTKNYRTYFSIYSAENPSKINRGYSYKEDWNTGVLYSVLRTILQNKNIETYNKTAL